MTWTSSVVSVTLSIDSFGVVRKGLAGRNLGLFLGLKAALLGSSVCGAGGFSVVVVDVVAAAGGAWAGLATALPASPRLGNRELNKSSVSFPDRDISVTTSALVVD